MIISVQPVTGEALHLDVEPSDTIAALKRQIQDRTGIPPTVAIEPTDDPDWGWPPLAVRTRRRDS